MTISIKTLERIFTNYPPDKLPGDIAHAQMTPEVRKHQNYSQKHNAKRSSVVNLFYLKNNIPHILYIKRPKYNGYHSGQVGFPGGKFEIGQDNNLQDTAIRECFEETGVMQNSIKLLSPLSELYIPVSNIYVQPYIGILPEPVKFKENSEVEYFIEVPVSKLIDNNNVSVTTMQYKNISFETPYFAFNGEVVWGATAMITNEIAWILRKTLKL